MTNSHNQTEGKLIEYIESLFAPQDDALQFIFSEMERSNIPKMNISATEGKLLYMIALMIAAKRILEIGTLRGYSGIHLARALPEDGTLITIEPNKEHVEAARRNFDYAGLSKKVSVHQGFAQDILPEIIEKEALIFDLIFIDARKDDYPLYLELTLPLLRKGGVLIADNTFRKVLEETDGGLHKYNLAVAESKILTSVLVPTIRSNGVDGLTISVKTGLE
jgi:caffeoyl-CoA O-methyltransferase